MPNRLPVAVQLKLWASMLRIRRVQERIADVYLDNEMRTPVHLCIGQEAISVGVCATLLPDDFISSNHRSHGHYLAKGGSLNALMAELHGRVGGCSGGFGGSMHLVAPKAGHLGSSSIVGGGIPIGTGHALASALQHEDRVSVVFLGDGAVEEGVLYESVNFAVLKRLPVIFVVENNGLAVCSPLKNRQPGPIIFHTAYPPEQLATAHVDGNDVEAVYASASAAVARARRGDGPSFIECATYRILGHSGNAAQDPQGYRDAEEVAAWKARCPLAAYEQRLETAGTLSAEDKARMETAVRQEIDAAFAFAKASPFPEPEAADAPVYCGADARPLPAGAYGAIADDAEGRQDRELAWPDAVHEALAQALDADSSVFVMGEGVDDPYGMFGATRDLHRQFGRNRVFDVPLAETGLTGVAVGAAQAGMRPVYFHNRPDFLCLAMDQLVNHAAKWAYMFTCQVPVPLVIWACIGRGWAGAGAQHSQALQSLFAHIPGLKVVMPSSCHDAKGLMLAAIADNNPVVIIDHRFNFRLRGPVPKAPYRVPLGKGVVRRQGKDVTVVATSHLVGEALEAADELSRMGIEAEVIDPRTLRPLDEGLILRSIAKTGRLIVADTDWAFCGFAAEVAALAVEKAFASLTAPVRRVTPLDTPAPAGYTLEQGYYVGKANIIDATLDVCKK